MRRNISTISNFKQNSNTNNLNRNKSPKRIVNGVKLYNFSQIQSYRYINKPYLNEAKKEHIKEKLQLQKTTEARVARRTKRNDMFVPFNHNPFSYQRLSKSLVNIALQDKNAPLQDKLVDEKNSTSKNDTSRDIIKEIDNLKNKKLDREVQSKQLIGTQIKAKDISALVQRQLNNSKISIHRQKKEMNKSMIALTAPKPRVQGVFDEKQMQKLQEEMEFDDIISMREQRHEQKKSKQMNIFKLLRDKQFFNKKFTTLDNFFFSFNSIFDKFQKYKLPFYRDMSRDSRLNISKKPAGKIENMETISQSEIQFNDLMNVAAGRFTPQAVYDQLNFDKGNQNSNFSEAEEEQIPYGQSTVNKGTAAEKYDQSIKEVQQFLKLALNKKEQSYLKLNISRKQAMKNQLEQVKRLLNISIYDKKMHKNLRKQVNNDLESFVNQKYRYPKAPADRDALIRANKEQKGKQQIIKLSQLVESFQIVKEHDLKVNQLINKRI